MLSTKNNFIRIKKKIHHFLKIFQVFKYDLMGTFSMKNFF